MEEIKKLPTDYAPPDWDGDEPDAWTVAERMVKVVEKINEIVDKLNKEKYGDDNRNSTL